MQREIKYRGQRVDTKEWVYGYMVKAWDETCYIITEFGPTMTCCDDCGANDMTVFNVIPETVGQYTGLNDKNGKEIYGGDIVSAEGGEKFTVKYGEHNTSEWNDNYELGFYVESNSEEEISRAIRTDIIFWVKYRKLEVIGNIHDNFDLLTQSPNDVS